ncbi:MAG: beta-propeller domain-containing protein, partial [Deltaproteobacteria bacterium]|nr:beta-propeller domain-containing protein [Deltaproteobacteria bacterium]
MKRILLATGILLLLGCDSSGGSSQKQSAAAASLVPRQNADVFMEFMSTTPASTAYCPVDSMRVQLSALEALPTSSVTETSFSMTNLQEAGVDEMDRIKFDGEHLFVANAHISPGWIGGGPGLVFLRPIRVTQGGAVISMSVLAPIDPIVSPPPDLAEIRVLALDPESPEAQEVGVIASTVAEGGIEGMYLLPGDDGDPHSLLAVLGQTQVGFDSSVWTSPLHTTLEIIDVTDPSQPAHE